MSADHSYTTRSIHGPKTKNPFGSLTTPIFQTSTFVFDSAEQGGRRFAGNEEGFIYTRLGNPTTNRLQEVVAMLEEGEACTAFASGMGAISGTVLSFLSSGDRLVADKALYGCTFALFTETLPRFGVSVEFIDFTDMAQVEAAVTPDTKMIYFETVANPSMRVVDIKRVSEYVHKKAAECLIVVDNTFASPVLVRPLTLGADIVVHSATKYLNGHGDVVAGFSVAKAALIKQVAMVGLKDITGSVLGPQEAFLIIRGIKTLALRMERICENAGKVASFLEASPYVSRVYYPGLDSHPDHAIAAREMSAYGGMIAFEMHSFEQSKQVLNHVQICTLAVSLGDCETLIEHPASMTHSTYTEEEIEAAGFSNRLIRLSVGLETPEDIISDLQQAFEAASK